MFPVTRSMHIITQSPMFMIALLVLVVLIVQLIKQSFIWVVWMTLFVFAIFYFQWIYFLDSTLKKEALNQIYKDVLEGEQNPSLRLISWGETELFVNEDDTIWNVNSYEHKDWRCRIVQYKSLKTEVNIVLIPRVCGNDESVLPSIDYLYGENATRRNYRAFFEALSKKWGNEYSIDFLVNGVGVAFKKDLPKIDR